MYTCIQFERFRENRAHVNYLLGDTKNRLVQTNPKFRFTCQLLISRTILAPARGSGTVALKKHFILLKRSKPLTCKVFIQPPVYSNKAYRIFLRFIRIKRVLRECFTC